MNNNNKENSASRGGGLSAEQKARISHNFRAAKALLARKRPRESDHLSLIKCVGAKAVASLNNGRNPLSDISTNTCTTPVSVNHFKLINSDCISNSCFTNPSPNVNELETRRSNQGTVLDSFRTPVRQVERVPFIRISSSDAIPNHLVLNNVGVRDEKEGVNDSFKTLIRNIDCCGSSCLMDVDVSRLESSNCVVRNEVAEDGRACNFSKSPTGQLDYTSSTCSMDVTGGRIGSSDSVSADDETVSHFTENSEQLDRFKSGQSGLVEQKISVVEGNGSERNSYITPFRKQGCSSLSESSTPCATLDEEFDDSIFNEIDALCENKPEVVAGGSLSTDMQLRSHSCEMSRDVSNTNSSPVTSVHMIKTECNLDPRSSVKDSQERSRSSDAALIGCMPEAYAKYMQSLNDRQREAACSEISVPLIIVAGPGSGKTSTMVGRVLMLLNEGIGPSHILAMTFTGAAASEMRDRFGAVAGRAKAKELMISTFHSFSLQLCRSHAEKLGRTPEFLIYGQGQQRRAIIEAVRLQESGKGGESNDLSKFDEESNGTDSPSKFKDKSKKWLKFVTQAKASGKNPEEFQKVGNEIGAAILQNYGNILKSCNALDYHDLISCSVKLLTDFPEVMEQCQESWKAIVIDEFQDTSAMQYGLLRILASHKKITIVGDEDQSIFSFNGADAFGFNSFRKDFPMHKEVRLNKNYRSTRCIIEAASFLIRNNAKRSESKDVLTDNSSGSKITIKECCTEEAQCAFVVDKILEMICDGSSFSSSFGNVAVLYRRQVSGKMFQTAFRDRKIPFNVHGVAFYRKKVVRAIISMLRTTLPGCDDGSFRRVFKALLPIEKEEKKKVIEHIDKISTVRKCSFISVAGDIFSAKVSGTFKRSQLTQGRKVVATLDMISKLVHREHSISAVITSVANVIPQKYLLEQRAVLDADGGKLLNEDNDLRSVLQYLLDDVSEFLTEKTVTDGKMDIIGEDKGCANVLKSFIDFISERESENFRSRKHDNEHSVTLTTIHQSKGLEWDTVFIVKANESEIPLLHEYNGVAKESASSLEEERRLLYVAMTRAKKELFILYVLMDSNWQVLQPSRFLKEIPKYLQESQDEPSSGILHMEYVKPSKVTHNVTIGIPSDKESTKADVVVDDSEVIHNEVSEESSELIQACNGNIFLKRFSTEVRTVVSHLFHHWAKKAAFQEPKRLLDKVGFVIDERLRIRKSTHKDVLRELKSCLKSDEAFQYADYVLKWEKIPADKRAYIMREKQEHFQKLRIESAMGSSAPTKKQAAYLRSLGCTMVPTSRLHASRLIEQYKSL